MTMLVSDPYFAGPRLPVAAYKSYVAANGGLGQYSQFIDEVVRVTPLLPVPIDDAIVCAQADYECGTWSSGYWTANGNAGGIGIYASGVASPFSVPNNGALSARIFIANIWLLLGEGPNLPPILSDVLNVAGLGPYLSRVNAAAKDPDRPLVRRIQDLNIAYTSSSGSSECTYACDPTYGQGIVARANSAVAMPNTKPPGAGGGTTPAPSPAAPDIGAQVAALAEKQLGKQYVWATHGPNTFDCSGLVCWCYAQVTGTWITCGSSEQWHSVGWGVPISALHKGDILCFDTEGTGDAGHVGIYDGKTSNGRHTMVNAENPSVGVVRADPFDSYFSPIYLGAKRLYNPPVPAPTTPLPISPPNPVPTPPGTPQPPSVVSRPLAQWSVLQLFFTQTNVGFAYTMPQEEVYKALAVGGNFPGKVKALSGGRCAIDHHWAIVNTPIATATALPDGTHYPNSTDIAATLAAYNWAAYDAVVVFFPNEGIPCGYDGTTATGTTGSYTTIRVNNATWIPEFELEMVVLQWMQEVSSTMTAKGFAHAPAMLSPNLYKSIGGLSYSDPATGRNNFLQDSMTNRLQELSGGSTAGISDAAWKAGPPVTPALTDPSRPITFPFDPVTYPAAVDWTTLQVGDVLLAANDNSTTFQATSGGAVLGDLPAGTLCVVKSLPQVTASGIVLTNVTTRYGDGWAPLGYADITTGYVDRCRNGSLDDDTTAVFPNTPSSQLSRVFLGETFVAKCECWGKVPYEGLRFDSARGLHLPAPRTIVAVAEVCGVGTLDFATCRLWSNRGPSVRGVPAAGYEDQRAAPLVLSSSQWQRLVVPAVEQDPSSPLEKVEIFMVFSSPLMTTIYVNNVHMVEC